jgi:hypothetical protein
MIDPLGAFLRGVITGAANSAAAPSANSHSTQTNATNSVAQAALKQAESPLRPLHSLRGDPDFDGNARSPSPITFTPPSGSGDAGQRELDDRVAGLEDRAYSNPSQPQQKMGLPIDPACTSAGNQAGANSENCTIA